MVAAAALATAFGLGGELVPGGVEDRRAGIAFAHDDELPPGPIRERHELMEEMGKQAKALNAALKAVDRAGVVAPAEAMAGLARRIPGLFPPGSTHPKSRAKPEIWQEFAKFEVIAGELDTSLVALSVTAKAGGDVEALGAKVMRTCKGCHDAFRLPKETKE
jgi:cytochrome c556